MTKSANSGPILRQISVKTIMDILVQGPRSRADLAKLTGLSKQTVSEVIRALEDAGWVHEIGTTTGHVGRSAVLYEIDSMAGVVLAIDISTNRFHLTLSDVLGNILASRQMTLSGFASERLIDDIIEHASDLVDEAAAGRPLCYACLATPGVVDPTTGILTLAPNLPQLMGTNLSNIFSWALGCDVLIENDVNAAIVGECWRGNAINSDHAAYVSLDTGVGLGIMSDGHLMRGANGAAGEVAFLPIGHDSTDYESIKIGALERSIGLPAILSRYATPEGPDATIAAFSDAVAKQDERALKTLEEMEELGSELVLSIQSLLDPDVIVIGGSMGLAPVIYFSIAKGFARRMSRPVKLVQASLGMQAVVTGATFLALARMYEQNFTPQLTKRTFLPPHPVLNAEYY